MLDACYRIDINSFVPDIVYLIYCGNKKCPIISHHIKLYDLYMDHDGKLFKNYTELRPDWKCLIYFSLTTGGRICRMVDAVEQSYGLNGVIDPYGFGSCIPVSGK